MRRAVLFISMLTLLISCKQVNERQDNKSSVAEESIDFYYDKIDIVFLKNRQVVGKEVKDISGKILFFKNEIKIYRGNEFERYFITEVVKHSDGYEIRTKNNKNDNCIIGVMEKNGNKLVTTHFTDIGMMGMFHISKNFSLEMGIYN